jgi:hypothetical protein
MTKVSYKGTVIVDSDNFEVVEGNKYVSWFDQSAELAGRANQIKIPTVRALCCQQ